jgi:hypothetical protein
MLCWTWEEAPRQGAKRTHLSISGWQRQSVERLSHLLAWKEISLLFNTYIVMMLLTR